MEENKVTTRDILKGVLSVILAAIAGLGTFFLLVMLFFGLGLMGWADGGSPEELRRLDRSNEISLVIAVVIALVVFIAVIIKVNKIKLKK